MPVRMVRARYFHAACGRYGRWFPVEEGRETQAVAQRWERHARTCGAAKGQRKEGA